RLARARERGRARAGTLPREAVAAKRPTVARLEREPDRAALPARADAAGDGSVFGGRRPHDDLASGEPERGEPLALGVVENVGRRAGEPEPARRPEAPGAAA